MLKKTSGNDPTQIDTAWIAAVQKLEIKNPDSLNDRYPKNNDDNSYAYQYDRKKSNYYETKSSKGELFYFDPNTISTSEWKRLGVRDKTIQTIEKYLNKGGHFSTPENLQKIYGLHKDEYERLKPYVKIESRTANSNEQFVSSRSKEGTQPAKNFAARYSVIDVNTADTSALISLPGIGSKLASRIVTFREKLGGFYSIDQIGETYGLPDSTFQKIKQYLKLENSSLRKININTATLDELKGHPYIKFSLANPIVAYRNEHGVFTRIEDIRKIFTVSEELYEKIKPYLTL